MYQYQNVFQQRIKSRIGGCLTSLVIFLLVVGGLGFVISRAHNGVTLSVGAHPTIISDSCNGPVFVQAGPANQVTLMGIFPQYTQDSASNTIEITQCDAGITLIAPPEANLQMDVNDEITVLGVSGIMQLSANGSRLTLEHVTLEGKSKVEDNGGAIVFNGTLSQGSASILSGNGGSLDVTLPASASFSLQLTGILGPFVSNFPNVQISPDQLGAFQANVGSNPTAAKLTLDLNDTNVVFSKSV
jgi:hypothetical protein